MRTVNEANHYIENNKNRVNTRYRQQIHLQPPIGWMNDPNGFNVINETIHVFYQYYPYDSQWGPMHWGHATTKNGMCWKDFDIALAPDKAYDENGCFSGTSLVVDNQIYLVYTGGYNKDDIAIQHQCLAISEDGIFFEKYEKNPIISKKNSPSFVSEVDFRDPKILFRDRVYYMFTVTKTSDNVGQLLLYTSVDLVNWEFKSIVFTGDKTFGEMFECPDYFEIDGKSIFIMSAILMPKNGYKYQNKCSCLYLVGQMDWESGIFDCEYFDEMDNGLDFYAPQVTHLEDGTPILIAWMQMWDRTIPSHELEHLWAGCMTIIRKLTLKGNSLYQTPLISYEPPYLSKVNSSTDFQVLLDTHLKVISLKNQTNCHFKLSFSNEFEEYFFEKKDNLYVFDRSDLIPEINGAETDFCNRTCYLADREVEDILIILDTSSIEIFIDNGRKSLSNRIFSQLSINQLDITIDSGSLTRFDIHDIKVDEKNNN